MELDYTILTQDGTNNTSTDGARDRYFAAGNRDGIIKGSLNEGALRIDPSNGVVMDSCVLLICGNPVILNAGWSKTFGSKPSTNERKAIVAQLDVDNNGHKTFDILFLPTTTKLVKNNLFKTLNTAGTYQVEIGRFTLNTSGLVENLTRTIDVITGGGTADSELHWGTITAYALGHNEDPEADFEQRYDEEQGWMVTDVALGIPSASIDNLDDTLSTTSHNAIENQAVANALNDRYTKNEADNLLSKKADLNNFNQNINALAMAIGTGNTNYFRIFTDDADTGSYLINYSKDITMQAGQNNVPGKNIHFKPSGSVISHGNLVFAYGSGKTAKVPTPTEDEDAVNKSYADSISTPIGGIIIWPGNVLPANFLVCNGTAVSRTTYAELYNVIGTTYGAGDGSTTFNIPNLTNRFPVGAGNLYGRGNTGGSKDAIVVEHTHGFTGKSKSGYLQNSVSDQAHNTSNKGIFSTSQGGIGFTGGKVSWYNLSINFTTDGTVNSTGSSGTDKNMPPYLGLYYIIRVK